MLRKLSIKNYAIIRELEISFSSNLNVITGETGAGKSILLGALSLILGERADSSALTDKKNKCVIEGIFSMPSSEEVKIFFEENELDHDEQILVRREISTSGKSRAFINDTPVTLQQLNALSQHLVDLHQQFDTLQLAQTNFQRDVLDALCDHKELLQRYRKTYHEYYSWQKKLLELTGRSQQAGKELDYIRFLHDELTEADFKENEIEELEKTLETLTHTEVIKQSLEKAAYLLDESEQPVLVQIKQILSELQAIEKFQQDLPETIQRLNSVYIELQDIADGLSRINQHIVYDAGKLEEVNERLSVGYRLLKKHHLHSTAELLQLQKQLEEQLQNVLNIDEEIAEAEKKKEGFRKQAEQLAGEVSADRAQTVQPFEQKVNELLKQVGMPNARLKVSLQTTDLQESGRDQVEFLFDANNNQQYAQIRKVASGGELSRLMLCIKSLVAWSLELPTLIFDEIDSGISGEAAKQVGLILKDLSKSHQVVCITHQPQIAGKGDAHYFVYKKVQAGKTVTNIRLLNREERVTTIAQMLSGERPTAAALENAKELIGGM
jgi:DNA repair protein RecN (Recombination protein N)